MTQNQLLLALGCFLVIVSTFLTLRLPGNAVEDDASQHHSKND